MPKFKVLIVEDEALIRMTTADMLEELGHEYVEAADAAEALAQLTEHPDIDVMITDLRLPGMSGDVLVGEVKRRVPHMKVVVASGYAAGHDSLAGLGPETVILAKPFQMSQLKRAIEGE